jgi:hypothetical protein
MNFERATVLAELERNNRHTLRTQQRKIHLEDGGIVSFELYAYYAFMLLPHVCRKDHKGWSLDSRHLAAGDESGCSCCLMEENPRRLLCHILSREMIDVRYVLLPWLKNR